jgi:uncharacterized protein involved in exopolysaccharide biosynthesis
VAFPCIGFGCSFSTGDGSRRARSANTPDGAVPRWEGRVDLVKESTPYQPDVDAIDWRTSLRRAKHAVIGHVPLILASVGFCLLLLVLYMRIFPPIYMAEAVLQGEPNDDVVRANYYSAWNLFRKGDLKSEPELVTSGRVAEAVVTALNLKFDDVHHSFLTHVGYLWTDSWLGKQYQAFKEWMFPSDPAAFKATPEQIEFARTVDTFKSSIVVESVPGTAIARVVVKAPTYRAAEFANKVVEVYLAERRKAFSTEAEAAYKSLAEEVSRAEADLAAIDQKKFDFDTKNKVVLDFEKDKLQVASWSALQVSINELTATIASLEASLAVVDQQYKVEPREIVSGRTLQDSKVKSLLQAREFELNSSLKSYEEKFVPTSPEVTELQKLLEETRSTLKREPDKVEVGESRILNPIYSELQQKGNSIRAQLASARAALAAKKAPLMEYEKRMDQMPNLVKTVLEQGRIREGLEMRYKILRDRAMQADVSLATISSAPSSVRVIDDARPPMKATWPRTLVLVPSALVLGLAIGFGLALWLEVFSSRVNRDRLASRPDIPVYAVIDLRPDRATGLAGAHSRTSGSVVDRLRRHG